MARRPFGGGGDAVVIDAETGDPLPFAVGTAWTARSGGTQILDVADEAGTTLPSSQIVTDAAGAIAPFLGPADGTAELWVDFGGGTRFLLTCTDLPERVAAVEVGGSGVPTTRTITTTAPLTGGGDLSANRTFAITTGTTSGTVAAGDDSRITGAQQRSTLTTKGDLYVATASGVVTRLPVGANGQIPIADSSQTTGLRWGYTNPVVVTLTDASTIAVNAAAGNHFRVTLGGNRTLGNPTGAVDGQRLLFEILQDGSGSRLLTLDTKFALGTDITAVTLTTTASKRDFLGVVYNSTADKFFVLALAKGY